MANAKDIALKIHVLDAQRNFLGGTVAVELKGQTINDCSSQRGLDASREINITSLRRAPYGDYQVTVTPSDDFQPKSQLVIIPKSGVAEVEFVFRKEAHDSPLPELRSLKESDDPDPPKTTQANT